MKRSEKASTEEDLCTQSKQKPQKLQSNLRVGVLDNCEDRNYRLNKYFETSSSSLREINGLVDSESQGLKTGSVNGYYQHTGVKQTDENANIKTDGLVAVPVEKKSQSFRTYFYAANVGSPKSSPRSAKDETFRAKRVNILRVKASDRSDLHDKSTGTEESGVNLSKTDDEDDRKVLEIELKTAVGVITPSKWKTSSLKEKVNTATQADDSDVFQEQKEVIHESKSVSDLISNFESQSISDIREKTERIGDSVNSESQVFDKGKGKANKCSVTQNKTVNHKQSCDVSKPVNHTSSSHRVQSKGRKSPRSPKSSTGKSPRSPNDSLPRKARKIVSYRTAAFGSSSSSSKLNPISASVSRSRLQSAPPTVEHVESIVQSQDKSEICDNSKMRESSQAISKSVGDSERTPRSESESFSLSSLSRIDREFDEVFRKNVENVSLTPRKKVTLSRKNRVDSDEKGLVKKYRKKSKERESKSVGENKSPKLEKVFDTKIPDPEPKLETVIDSKNAQNDLQSAKTVSKSGSVRRKLPEIPLKKDSDIDDDETVHQRTLRLLQERKKERREKFQVQVEKVVPVSSKEKEKHEKGKLTPADLKKSLEQKLERSDSKKKAMRVRRELQLLDREKEAKSASHSSSNEDEADGKNNLEIINILGHQQHHKFDKSVPTVKEVARMPMHRSKSENVVRRALSETDTMFRSQNEEGERTDPRVEELMQCADPKTPLEKIDFIGTLMQEEARIQELVSLFLILYRTRLRSAFGYYCPEFGGCKSISTPDLSNDMTFYQGLQTK